MTLESYLKASYISVNAKWKTAFGLGIDLGSKLLKLEITSLLLKLSVPVALADSYFLDS